MPRPASRRATAAAPDADEWLNGYAVFVLCRIGYGANAGSASSGSPISEANLDVWTCTPREYLRRCPAPCEDPPS